MASLLLPTPAPFFPWRPPPPLAASHTAHSLHAAILRPHPPCRFPLLQPSEVGGGGKGHRPACPKGEGSNYPTSLPPEGGFTSSACLPFLTSSRADSAPRVYGQGFSIPDCLPSVALRPCHLCSPKLKPRRCPLPALLSLTTSDPILAGLATRGSHLDFTPRQFLSYLALRRH